MEGDANEELHMYVYTYICTSRENVDDGRKRPSEKEGKEVARAAASSIPLAHQPVYLDTPEIDHTQAQRLSKIFENF